jgi:hypothetical protein
MVMITKLVSVATGGTIAISRVLKPEPNLSISGGFAKYTRLDLCIVARMLGCCRAVDDHSLGRFFLAYEPEIAKQEAGGTE